MLLPLLVRQSVPAKTWFGPVEVSFNIQYAGNPYDPAVNETKVKFTSDTGFSVERPAYFAHGAWRAVIVAPMAGHYKAKLIHNGVTSNEEAVPSVLVVDQKLAHGYVNRDGLNTNRLEYDDGTEIFPCGFNLAWQTPGGPRLEDEVVKMARAGLNWTRIWAYDLDNMDAWWPHDDPFAIKNQLWPKALDQWAKVTSACDGAGVDYQFVLFHSSAFSSAKDGEWAKNPWNAANGGFMKSADDFFTDPEAKRRAKMWVRYAAVRWSADPHLFAWELFDEVENTDAAKDGHWKEISEWHKEMAGFIRSLDPYGHLVTTSSDLGHPELWLAMDFYQPHHHSESILDRMPNDKPGFYGEFGPSQDLGMGEAGFIDNIVWQSIRQNRSAPAMYWHWDRVETLGLYTKFQTWAQVIAQSGVSLHPQAVASDVASTLGHADGLRDINWVLVRLRGADGQAPKLVWPGMIDGTWLVTAFDLSNGESYNDIAIAKGPRIQLSRVKGNDVVMWLRVSD